MLRESEAAKRLGVTARTLGQWRWQRRGPRYVKVGTAVRYRLEDVEAFLVANTVETRDSAQEGAWHERSDLRSDLDEYVESRVVRVAGKGRAQ